MMSTIAEQLQEAADKATQASEQAGLWATGPDNTTVPTDSGPVPTIAEFNRAAQARVDASIEAIGWVLAGDFTAGCTVTDRNQYVLVVGGAGYRWDGALPKVVAPGSSPTPIATGAWVLVGDATFSYTFRGPDNKGLDDFFGGGGWTSANASTGNIYNTAYDTNDNALRWRFDVPLTGNQLPILYLKKTISTTREIADGGAPSRWDEGAIYAHIVKESGSAFSSAFTSVIDAKGGKGDSVSVHARAFGRNPHVAGGVEGAGVWGLWSFVVADPSDGTLIKQALGLEIDLVNNGAPMPFPVPSGQGNYIGAQVSALNNVCGHGVEIGAALGGSWNRGVFIRQDAITPSGTYAGTTAIEIEGGTFGNRYGGITFGKGYLEYGINLAKPSGDYANLAAIILGDGDRIFMGGSASAANYIAKVAGQPQINFQNMTIAVNGVKVVGTRVTGFARMTGTPLKTSFNADTATVQQVAQRLKAIEDALHADSGHGLYGLT